MSHEIDARRGAFPAVREIGFGQPLVWLARGWRDFLAAEAAMDRRLDKGSGEDAR